MSKSVTIFNAKSAQAAPIVAQAIEQGFKVRAISRNIDDIKGNETERLTYQQADLLNKEEVVAALDGVDAAFLHFPVPSDFSHPRLWLQNIIEAAYETKLPLLVFSTSGPAGEEFASTPMIDGNKAIKAALLESGLNVIILEPTIYLENLFVPPFVPRLHSEGVLTYPPVPADQRLALVSHVDQAKIAVAAMLRPNLAGKSYKISSPHPITGPELAKALAPWTGKDVTFAPDSPAAFGKLIGELFGDPAIGAGLTGLYESIIDAGNEAASINVAALEQVFDVKLTDIAEHIRNWPKP